MSTPDDVQRATARLAQLDDLTALEQIGRNVWNTLVELGWTPPGNPHKPPDQEHAAALQAAHDDGYAEAQAEAQFHIEQAYNRGRRDMANEYTPCGRPTTSPENWTPVPLRWRHVRAGDVVLGDTTPWMVTEAIEQLGEPLITIVSGDQTHQEQLDPDEVVCVLCPASEANALARVRDELGGTVVDRTV